MQAYSDVTREDSPTALPDVEVFEVSRPEHLRVIGFTQEDGTINEPGFYYWFCFPGCLPDSDPIGPFDTEDLALEDARSN